MRTIVVRSGDGRLVSARCAVADTALTRLRGVLGRPLAAGDGLLLRPCAAVHTAFLRAPLTVAFLDGDGRVLRVERLEPWRAAACRGARAVLELPAGTAVATGEGLCLG